MKSATLIRIENGSEGCFGAMLVEGKAFCVTIERPWLNNQHIVSCIPAGEYQIKIINSPRHGKVYEVQNVPNRSDIQIHIANFYDELEGCIALGQSFATIGGKRGIANSKQAIWAFMLAMGEAEANLIIREAYKA
jgi:hypothetical protein